METNTGRLPGWDKETWPKGKYGTKHQKNKLNKMETSNLPDAELKTLAIMMLNELRE